MTGTIAPLWDVFMSDTPVPLSSGEPFAQAGELAEVAVVWLLFHLCS